MFTFNPKSEAEIQAEEQARLEEFLWPAGDYPYEIVSGGTHTSKEVFDEDGNFKSGGNKSVKLKVRLFKDDGKYQEIFDYLAGDGKFAFKLRHAAYASGLGGNYESGKLNPSDFEGKTGVAKVFIQKAQNGYPAKNSISDYVLDQAASVQYSAAKTEKSQKETPHFFDEIPFSIALALFSALAAGHQILGSLIA